MIRLRRSFLVPFFVLAGAHVFAADTRYQEGDTALGDATFHYIIFVNEPGAEQQRHIEVRHLEERYAGPLAELSFRDRHLRVFKMVAELMQASCRDGVGSLGNLTVSKDPERDSDPEGIHPQFFVWDYSCK